VKNNANTRTNTGRGAPETLGHADYLNTAHLVRQVLLVESASFVRFQLEWFRLGGLFGRSHRQAAWLQTGQGLSVELTSLVNT